MLNRIKRIWDKRGGLSSPPQWLTDALQTTKTTSGVTVNEVTSLEVSAVFACVRVISEAVASLPLFVYRRDGENRSLASDHPLFSVLHRSPSADMTSFTYRQTMQSHVLIYGNGYSEIVRDNGGRVREIVPMLPDRTKPRRASDGSIEYEVRAADGRTTARVLPGRDVLHIPGLSFDGLMGYAPLSLAKETVGLAKAAEQMAGSFYGNNSVSSGVLEYDGTLGDDEYKRLRDNWETLYKGPEKAYKVAILEQGLKFKQLTIAGREAQFLESRRFAVEEIARRFNVPPSMIQDHTRSTFSNVEQQALSFVMYTLRPWLVSWEQELARKLFAGEPGMFAEHRVEGLLRADFSTRMSGYVNGRQWGWLSANDIRKLENMSPIDGGDSYLVPLNMQDSTTPQPQVDPVRSGIVPTTPPTTPTPAAIESKPEPPQRDRFDRIAAAHEPVMVDALRSVVRTEREKVRRNSKRADFDSWLDAFYTTHVTHVRNAITPCVEAYAASVGCDEYDAQVGEWAASASVAYVEQSLAQVRSVEGNDRRAGIAEIIDDWERDRIPFEAGQMMVRLADFCASLSD